MNKEEIFNILYDKEKWDVWHKVQDIEKICLESNCLYKYFDDFYKMLLDDKLYIKLRGFIIICSLAKWDCNNKINDIIDTLLNVLDCDKPSVVRMCLDSISRLIMYKPKLCSIISDKFKKMDLSKYKDSMRPLIEKDINAIMENING